jgi:hypothetical protein
MTPIYRREWLLYVRYRALLRMLNAKALFEQHSPQQERSIDFHIVVSAHGAHGNAGAETKKAVTRERNCLI